jgi:hypothetical protein
VDAGASDGANGSAAGSPPAAMADAGRGALDRLAQWLQTEFRLIIGEVRGLAREVRGLVGDVKEVFAALDTRMALLEQRVAAMEPIEPIDRPDDRPPPGRSCRRAARRRPGGRGSCRGRRPDH